VLYPVLLLLRRPARQIAWTATFALAPLSIAVGGLLYSARHEILLALGRTGSLTGRIPLWFAVAKSISHHPWLGYGFASFFNNFNPESRVVALRAKWVAEHAHNGYLDILLDVGLLGFALFGIGFLVTLWRAGKSFRFSENFSQRWPLVFLFFIALYNFAESDLMRITAFFWIPYVSTFISLALAKPFEVPEMVAAENETLGERETISSAQTPDAVY
jgi:exopolysaccharide production protein ExoQ